MATGRARATGAILILGAPRMPSPSRRRPRGVLAVGEPAGPPGPPGPAGDQVVDEQQDGRSGDGSEPGGQVEEPLQAVDVEQLGGSPAPEQRPGDADQAGDDEAL